MFNTGMQGFDAGPGGPAISGKWINRQNGRIVNVRDSVIEGDNMIVITDCGNINMMDFSKNYVQASENIYDEHGNVIGTEEVDPSELLYMKKQTKKTTSSAKSTPKQSEIKVFADETDQQQMDYDNMFSDDSELIFGINKNNNEQAPVKKSTNPKLDVIGKIFDKIDSKPRIEIKLNWADFPSEDIQVLGKYFDITNEDIAQYLCDKYVTKEDIASAVETFLMNI